MANEQVTNHPIKGELQQIVDLCEQALARYTEAAPRATLRRIEEVADHIRTQFAQTRASLVPMPALESAYSSCQQARNSLESLLATNDLTQVATTNTQMDHALMEIRALPPLPFKVQAATVASAANEYEARLLASESAVMAAVGDLNARVDSATAAFDTALAEQTAQLDAQGQAAETIKGDAETLLTGLRTEITAQKARLDTALTEHQTAFSAAQEKRLEDANTVLKALETDLTAKSTTLITDVTARQNAVSDKSEQLVTESQAIQKRANELLGFTGAANVATAYKDEAEAQKKEADIWRIRSLAVIVALAIAAFVAFVLLPPDSGFDTTDFVRYALIRLPIFLVLAPGAQWMISQAGDHRNRERRARLRQQELTAFRPFIQELEGPAQKTVIAETAPKYFDGGRFDLELGAIAKSNAKAQPGLIEAISRLIGRA